MLKSSIVSLVLLSSVMLVSGAATAQNQAIGFSGRVNRVWEDGFQLNTRDRSITVDSYDICGDNTERHITVGEQVTITGEFEGGEFDAFSITKASGESVCR